MHFSDRLHPSSADRIAVDQRHLAQRCALPNFIQYFLSTFWVVPENPHSAGLNKVELVAGIAFLEKDLACVDGPCLKTRGKIDQRLVRQLSKQWQ